MMSLTVVQMAVGQEVTLAPWRNLSVKARKKTPPVRSNPPEQHFVTPVKECKYIVKSPQLCLLLKSKNASIF